MTETIYQDNPYLREITAKIVKKEYSNGKFYITLDRTIFYPHMKGGQPKDNGTIDGVKVIDVYEEDGFIIHVTNDNIVNEKVSLSIDWNTRFDHMQQHTGQHILSTAFSKLLNGETAGFHLGCEYVTIDINLPTLNDNDIEIIEKFANQIIFSNFNIKTYIIGQMDVSKLPLRKSPTVDNNIRIVEIDNIDYSPCSGTHTRTTGEVGLVKIRKYEKYKGMNRIEFVCGVRALEDYILKNNQISKISTLLSVNDKNTYEGVERLFNENKELNKKVKDLNNELLSLKAVEIENDFQTIDGYKFIAKIFDDFDFKDIRNIAMKILSNNENIVVLMGVSSSEKSQFIIGRSTDLQVNMKNVFDENIKLINGNGGGNKQVVQGGCTVSRELLEDFFSSCAKYVLDELQRK